MINKFPKPDEHGFFAWNDGGIWGFDGDKYIVRNSAGEELEVTAELEDFLCFRCEDGEWLEEKVGFGDYSIKPAGPNDGLTLHVKSTGETLEADLLALEKAFPSVKSENK